VNQIARYDNINHATQKKEKQAKIKLKQNKKSQTTSKAELNLQSPRKGVHST